MTKGRTSTESPTKKKQGSVLPFPGRGQRLWERMLACRQDSRLSLARAKLVLSSYRETEGFPPPLRRAKALEAIAAGMPLFLEEGDLLAGEFAARPMNYEWYPEYAVDQEMAAGQLEGLLGEGDTEADVREIIGYFKDRCLQHSYLAGLDEEKRKIIAENCEDGAWVYRAKTTLNIDRGYHAVDFEKVIHKGLEGVLAEVREELRTTPVTDEPSYQKNNFLKGLEIVLRAGMHYAKRHASLLRELARKTQGPRREELARIAAICERVPARPARSFHEAVQAVCFLHVLMHLESRAQVSLGRMDQYLYPYYRQDIDAGRLTKEEALEILDCLRVKLSTLRLFNGVLYNEIISGDAQYHNITLSGQTADARDATNELSFLFLEAAWRTRTPHPTLSIRFHDKIPRPFVRRALELVRVGLGFPAFFNDRAILPWLLASGAPLETARGYCLSGCVHHTIPGQSSPLEALFFSLPKCLELALHNGFDPRTQRQVGPKTGEFVKMKSFAELLEGFKTQVEFFARQGGAIIGEQRVVRTAIAPTMLASAFVDDCIPRGKSCLGDGARYVLLGQVGVGMIDAADSLAAVKKCVFDDRILRPQTLLDALAVNFKGKEGVRKALLQAPKYGNDEDFADSIATEIYGWWWRMVGQIDAAYGWKFLPSPYSVSAHGAAGKRVGALPSGRLAHTALADGAVSPCPGADVNGPTALMNSAGKIDQSPLFGTLLNMKFHPSALKTPEDLAKLQALIKTYFDYGGKHVQFNVIDSKVLREAQENPENYRNLIVRVAGYSALFNELHRSIQDEIISRTGHTMGAAT
jgi:pyruvate formate-lyase/glycerol dehydratase family glycyl radical enzyme